MKFNLMFIFKFVFIYLSNVDININQILLYNGSRLVNVFLRYTHFPIIPELDGFFEQVFNILSFLEETALILQINVHSTSILGTETILRFFKLPLTLCR